MWECFEVTHTVALADKVDVIRAHVNVKRPLKDIFAVMDDNKGRAAWDKSYALNKSSVLDDWQDPELTRVVWYHDVQGSMLGGIISARDLCNIRYSKMISEDEGLFVRRKLLFNYC